MGLLIKHGHVLNPATDTDEVLDVRIQGNQITEVGQDLIAEGDQQVIDATGCFVFPGFIDLHVHLRDPGLTEKEDIASGSRAAAHGGYTTVVAMPNTKPVADSPEVIQYVQDKAAQVGLTHVLQVGSVTKGMAGKELSDLEGMIAAGIPAISEDGKSVMDSNLYREAMKIVAAAGIPVLAHCEDINLVNGGVINQGAKSKALGVGGISNAVENIIVARDIMLAEETGATLHLCHCSTKESVDMVRDAKAKGIKVSGEVCPHHFTLTEDDIVEGNTNYKMNPPLRQKADVEALKQGLKEGIMEVISTDHAPHTPEEKARDLQGAPFGIVGMETAAALTYTELVLPGVLTPLEMAAKMSTNPARILGIDKGNLSAGYGADVTIFDPRQTYEIHSEEFYGKGKNMPYEGRKVTGRVVTTILDGEVVFQEGKGICKKKEVSA
jgi:dihydroorotase